MQSHSPQKKGWIKVKRMNSTTHLALCGGTDDELALLSEGHNGRGGAPSLTVLNNTRGLALHDSHTGVGGAEIDTDHRPRHLAPARARKKKKKKAMDR
jgi:hypothetical protein